MMFENAMCSSNLQGTKAIIAHKGPVGERGGSVVECRTPEREVGGVRNLPPPCCVLEQETLLPENTG